VRLSTTKWSERTAQGFSPGKSHKEVRPEGAPEKLGGQTSLCYVHLLMRSPISGRPFRAGYDLGRHFQGGFAASLTQG
jgi:hypothetical protein